MWRGGTLQQIGPHILRTAPSAWNNSQSYTATIESADMTAWENWQTACGATFTPSTFRLELGPHYALPSTSFSFDSVVFDDKIP